MDIKKLKQLHRDTKQPAATKSNWLDTLLEFSKKDIKLFKGFGDKNKERFFSETGMLLSSGVDLHTVLQICADNYSKKDKLAAIYNSILVKVSKGTGLATAMEGTGQFNNFDCYSVLIGENTGELATVFSKLATYYNKKTAQSRKILSALSYPIVVLFTTVLAVVFMLKFVVPMFAKTLLQFGGELPALTRYVIAVSDSIGTYLWLGIAIIITAVIWYRQNKHKDIVRHRLSSLLLKLPYIGAVIKKTHLLRFTQAMELLLSARVTLVESIELTQKMTEFYPLAKALEEIKADIVKGRFFYQGIARQPFFEQAMVTLVKIGEEVNQLDRIFLQLSKQYEAELEQRSTALVTFLEPVMILLLAVVIGVILISMYLPMFKIGSVIG